MIPKSLPGFPNDVIALQLRDSIKLYAEQLYSNESVRSTLHHVAPKVGDVKQLPFVFTAEGFPITADLGACLWCMSQAASL